MNRTMTLLSGVFVIAGLGCSDAPDLPVALDGQCAVCLGKMYQLVQGKPEFTLDYDGKMYQFPSARQKQMFDADPTKYVPALGGDCVVSLVEMGERLAGKAEYALVHEDRVYLFQQRKQLDMFKQNPGKYADADVALGGNCPVSSVDMGKDVAGKREFAVDHHSRRYLFPDARLRDKFFENPSKYSSE